MMMSFGLFIFTLPTVVYQELAHKRDMRFAFNARIGAPDAVQFIGPGIEEISLSGVTAHGINHPNASFALLNTIMQAGKDQPLIDGLGNVFGNYILQSIDLNKSSFRKFGQAKRTEWELSLRRADNPGGAIRNAVLDQALEALGNPERMIANRLSIASLAPTLPVPLPGLKF